MFAHGVSGFADGGGEYVDGVRPSYFFTFTKGGGLRVRVRLVSPCLNS